MTWKLAILAVLYGPALSYADIEGAISGGGGKSMVCRDSSRKIISAESFDLYEGVNLYGLKVRSSAASVASQLKRALQTLPANSHGVIDTYLSLVQKNMRFSTVPLTPIDDPSPIASPDGCEFEQLANYYNDNLVLINQDIWSHLNNTSKAALLLHEAVYASNRVVGALDSRQSRHIVASLFDTSTHWQEVKDQIPKTALTCNSSKGGLLLSAFKNTSGNWTLQFQILGGGWVVSKKSVLEFASEFNFEEAKNIPIIEGEDMIGTGTTDYGQAESAFENGDIITVSKYWEHLYDENGNVRHGYQILHYYLSWSSATYPKTSTPTGLLNCSVQQN